VEDADVAVCLLPGTEIVFDSDVRVQRTLFRSTVHERLARFRKINIEQPHQHHDALEFANGTIVLVNELVHGQQAVVLQLPADPTDHGRSTEQVTEEERVAEIATT
jgi:hypothetical protein